MAAAANGHAPRQSLDLRVQCQGDHHKATDNKKINQERHDGRRDATYTGIFRQGTPTHTTQHETIATTPQETRREKKTQRDRYTHIARGNAESVMPALVPREKLVFASLSLKCPRRATCDCRPLYRARYETKPRRSRRRFPSNQRSQNDFCMN